MDSFLRWTGTLLEFVLMWRLVGWKAWRPYPYFFGFFVWIFCRLLFFDLQELTQFLSASTYVFVFWGSSALTAALRFLIFWEVYRHALPRRTAPYRVAAILLSAALTSLAVFFNLAASKGGVFTLVISNLSFAVAVCLLVILGLIRYYQVNPGLNIWGMAIGTGILCALDVLNFSAFDLDHGFFPIMRYVRPVSFFAQLAIWLVTLWHFAPPVPPQSQSLEAATSGQSGLTPLSGAVASVSKAVGLKGQTDQGEGPSKRESGR